MPQRSRRTSANHTAVLAGLAAPVLAAALALTALLLLSSRSTQRHPAASPTPTTTISTKAPYRLGGRDECPPDWPVLAMSDHTSYPAGHPTTPPAAATAVACYQTTARAASAGYPPAPLPAGALEVGGVYLTPTSQRFRIHCQQAADRVGFAVPCPGLLPTSPPGVPRPRLCQETFMCQPREVLVFHQDFVAPFGAVGAPGGYGALSIMATPTHGSGGLQCPGEHPIATPTVQQTQAVLTACQDEAPSVLGGSVRLRWSQHDTVVVVSVPGQAKPTGGWSSPWPTTCALSAPDAADPTPARRANHTPRATKQPSTRSVTQDAVQALAEATDPGHPYRSSPARCLMVVGRRGVWVRSEVEGMGVMAKTGPLQRLTAQNLLIMLRPADLDWPKDVGAFAVPDPIGAEGRLATLR